VPPGTPNYYFALFFLFLKYSRFKKTLDEQGEAGGRERVLSEAQALLLWAEFTRSARPSPL
jgi:hypothetical protein